MINFEVNHMSKNSTATATVIPFHFEAKQVRTLLIADEPWFAAKDIVSVLGYAASSAPAKLVEHVPAQWKGVNPIHTPGGVQKLLMLSEQGLYFFLGRSDKQKALPFQMWLAGEVLPAIRRHGHYSDDSGKMGTLVNDVIGMSGANLIGGVISQKVSVLPTGVQRQAKHKLHAILHTRFNVPRTEMIPADKLDTACQYIGAYTLEGEWLQKEKGLQIEPGRNRRYLVSFGHKGEQRITPVPEDACVMTHQQLIKAMLIPGDLPVSTEDMFEFAQAALANLKMRSDCQTQQLRAARAAA